MKAALRAGEFLRRRRSLLPELERAQADESPVLTCLGRITDWVAISGAHKRWTYTFEEVEIDGSGSFVTKTGGFTGTAYNVAEAGNTSGEVANGVDPDNFPGTFDVQHASGIVELTARRRTTGALVWTFSAPVIDGTCE